MQAKSNDSAYLYFISLQNGKEEGFRYFFDLHYRSLLFYAKRLLKDDVTAEDMVEDCFLKLFEKRNTLRSEDTLKSFLFTILKNACLDWLERNKTKARYQREASHSCQSFQNSAIEEMIRTETLSLVLEAMEQLPPATRRVFKMLYIEGKSYDEISRELNRSKETVRKQRNQGLIALRKKLLILLFFLVQIPALYSLAVL